MFNFKKYNEELTKWRSSKPELPRVSIFDTTGEELIIDLTEEGNIGLGIHEYDKEQAFKLRDFINEMLGE